MTYTVTVKDQFLASGNRADAYVAYMLEGDTDWRYINLFEGNDGSASVFSKNDDVYTRELTIDDGDVLTNLEIYVCDNAGNVTKELTHSGDECDHSDAFALNEVNNHHIYQGYDLAVDKSAPVVTVTKTVKDGKFVRDVTENGQTVDLYDGQVTYTVNVQDCFLNAVAADQIGFAKLIYSVEGKGTEAVNLFDCVKDANNMPSVLSNNVDEYEYLIVLDNGDVLTSLQISVEDNAGNVSKQVEVADEDSKTGFKLETVTEEIEVTEPETTEPETTEPEVSEPEVSEPEVSEPETTEPETTEPEITEPETTESEVIEPETREYLVYNKNWVAVDTKAPEVTITKTVEDGYEHVQTIAVEEGKDVDFYNGKVTYTVDVTDQFLVSGSGSQAVVTYKVEGDKTVYSLNLFDKAVTQPSILSHNEDAYTCEFTLNDGQVLEAFAISVKDNADNQTTAVTIDDQDKDQDGNALTKFDGCSYNGNPVCVDMTDPVVKVYKTVEKGSKFVQTYNHTGEGQDTDYYDGKVTYKFVVTDTNLTNAANQVQTLILTYKLDGQKQKSIVLPAAEGGWSKEEVKGKDQYTYSFDVEDGKILTDMTVKVIDNARNAAEVVDSKDKSGLTKFDGCSYVGNDVLVDATTPKVKINIDVIGDDVKNYYINESGVAYIKLTNKITDFDESGKLNNQKDVTLTMTVTATDDNLTLVEDNDFRVYNDMEETDGLTWSGAPKRNKNSTVKFEKSVTVSENTVEILPFCLMVTDLAGNTVPMENIQLTLNGKEAQEIKDQITLEDGMFDAVLAVDRRRPSSVDNGEAPVIEIEPAKKSTITSNNGRELYSKEFNFKVTIADGMGKNNLNAGLAKVRWYFVDGSDTGFVKTNETEFTYKAGTYTKDLTIPVEVNGIGESNKAKLVVIATDNAGNVNKATYEFAIDNEAPRVTVSYDNNTALNSKYFKADRLVTVTVEDINFNADTTPITTEVADPGWSSSGIVHTTTRTYNVDGDYTFAMECFDRANNQAEIDLTNGGTNVAYDAFTVDKTAPVISISFNPADAKDQDEKNVYHFDTDRTLTVSITEVNFKGEEVVAQMGEKNSLGRWTSNGNIHTAYTTFTPGNEYNVELNYTDLAGNPAKSVVSETFTVDDKAPTIEITTGEATLGELKIVQDDLVLGLTVNDAEGNLKGEPEVELIYIGTDFQQKKVDGVAYYTVSETVDRTTYAIDFTNIEKIKSNDGIYTLRVKTSDYAGHQVTLASDLVFSLNRFGSTFTAEDEFTKSFLNNEAGTVYHNKVEGDLVIKEINPNEVKQGSQGDGNGSLITVSANGVSKVLVNGADYEVKTEQKGNSTGHKWYEYTYTIYAGNFKDDNGELINGKYEILFYSEDAAGNKNTNEANEGSSIQVDKDGNPSGAINFVLDSHTPVVSVIGIEDGSQFNASNKTVQIDVSDNTPHTIEVYIDDVLVTREDDPQKLVNSNDWLTYDEENSSYTLNLKEDNFGRDIRVVVIDAAGNPTEHEIKNVQVTENLFFLFINNTWLVVGSVLGLAVLIVVIVVLVRRKKEKKEA